MNDRTVLVVGGTSGIGKNIVEQLTSRGCMVIAASRSADGMEPLSGVTYAPFDATDFEQSVPGLPPVLDGVVYCPGSINLRQMRSLKVADFQRDWEVNVLGAVHVLKQTYNLLKKSDAASVVLFSTVAVGQGMPFHSSVAAAKGAVEGLTRSLAAEWSPKIRVNCIAPSLVDTPLASSLLSTPERIAASEKRHPLKRVGQVSDIGNMALYLLSDQSSWISGQVIGVDGGLSTLRT